jgi:hypothetical protein
MIMSMPYTNLEQERVVCDKVILSQLTAPVTLAHGSQSQA